MGDVDTDQAGEMMDFFTTPVAGDKMIKIVYALTMLTCVALFLSALATAAPTWAEPITSVTLVQADSIPFPDIYMCYDSEFASLFGDGFVAAKYVTKTLNDKHCQGMTSLPSLTQLNDEKSQKCFIEKTEVSKKIDGGLPTVDQTNTERKIETVENAKAKQLAALTPKVTGTTTDPFCYAYPANGATIGSAESGTHTFFAWDFKPLFAKIKGDGAKFGQIMEKGQFATLYLVEAGGEVVKDNKATVEGVMFPAFGTISLASMEADQVKNELAGDTKFHWHYRASVTNFADRASHYFKSGNDTYVDDSWTMASVFKIYSFTVNQIHIRAITFGEIWTQIGGLWGGAILVMSLVFTGSGYVRNHDQKELLVFRYQSAKKKKEALKMVASGVSKKVEDEETEKQEMKDRIAKLEAQIEQLTK